MLHRDVQQHLHLLERQAGAGGVAGVGDHDCLGLRGDAGLEPRAVGVEIALFRLGVQGMDDAAGGGDEGVIVGIERFGDDDLVTVVEQAVGRNLQRLTAAGGDENVRIVQLHANSPIIVLNGGDQRRHAGRCGVGQDRLMERVDRFVQGVGRMHVRLADIQMIDLFACCRSCHCIGMEFTHRGLTA